MCFQSYHYFLQKEKVIKLLYNVCFVCWLMSDTICLLDPTLHCFNGSLNFVFQFPVHYDSNKVINVLSPSFSSITLESRPPKSDRMSCAMADWAVPERELGGQT